MITITLPDGSRRDYEQALTVGDVAASIGAGLAKAALAGRVGVGDAAKLVDLSYRLDADTALAIVTDKGADGLEVIRHSTAIVGPGPQDATSRRQHQLLAVDAHSVTDAQFAGVGEVEVALCAVVEPNRHPNTVTQASVLSLGFVANQDASHRAQESAQRAAVAAAAKLATNHRTGHAAGQCAVARELSTGFESINPADDTELDAKLCLSGRTGCTSVGRHPLMRWKVNRTGAKRGHRQQQCDTPKDRSHGISPANDPDTPGPKQA